MNTCLISWVNLAENMKKAGQRDGSVNSNVYCSFRRPQFSSQHPQHACNCSCMGSDTLKASGHWTFMCIFLPLFILTMKYFQKENTKSKNDCFISNFNLINHLFPYIVIFFPASHSFQLHSQLFNSVYGGRGQNLSLWSMNSPASHMLCFCLSYYFSTVAWELVISLLLVSLYVSGLRWLINLKCLSYCPHPSSGSWSYL